MGTCMIHEFLVLNDYAFSSLKQAGNRRMMLGALKSLTSELLARTACLERTGNV